MWLTTDARYAYHGLNQSEMVKCGTSLIRPTEVDAAVGNEKGLKRTIDNFFVRLMLDPPKIHSQCCDTKPSGYV